MKKLILKTTLVFSALLSTFAHAQEASIEHASKYILVGVAGFKTGRATNDKGNIFSRELGKGKEPSGVWENLETNHKKILHTVYLTHYSKDNEIKDILELFVDDNNNCRKDVGLILMVNSWGAVVSQKLARQYADKCNRLPHLTVMIDTIERLKTSAFNKPVLSYNCINYYQTHSTLHGDEISNCINYEIKYESTGKRDYYVAHIDTEWRGSSRGNREVLNYLNQKLDAHFMKKQFGIDY